MSFFPVAFPPLPDSCNSGADGSASALAVQADEKFLAGGAFPTPGGKPPYRHEFNPVTTAEGSK